MSETDERLCVVCVKAFNQLQDLGLESHASSPWIDHHVSQDSLESTYAQGCPVCIELCASSRIPTLRTACSWCLGPDRWFDPVISIYFKLLIDKGRWHVCARFHLALVQPDQDRLLIVGYGPSRDTGSAGCLQLAQRWLNICHNEHATCERPRPLSPNTWKPTRLVCIDSDNDLLRLVERDSILPNTTYTTLSHCWGEVRDKLVLTLRNIDQWKQVIPSLGNLKTFRDAIQTTHRFGVRYIWIDSLCIIQDSPEDWTSESSRMADVYKYSYCNIAATAATNDNVGCFASRDPLFSIRVDFSTKEPSVAARVDSSSLEAMTGEASERIPPGTYDLQKIELFERDLDDAHINTRAWVVQERLLAPRVLNFGKEQLHWECNELLASELHPYGESCPLGSFKRETPFNLLSQAFAAEDLSSPPAPADALKAAFGVWASIVRASSRGKLTIETDKLVAISAIVREMKPVMQCRYLAGLWETNLVGQLGWYLLLGGSRPPTYRAPSWSWASVDGEVFGCYDMYNDLVQHYQPLIEVLETHIELASQDEMGHTTGGYLRVRGRLVEIEIGPGSHILVNGEAPWILVNRQATRMALHVHEDDENHPLIVKRRLQCLPINFRTTINPISEYRPLSTALVLEKVDHLEAFQRVGVLRYSFYFARRLSNGSMITDDPDPAREPLLQSMGTFTLNDDGTWTFVPNTSGMQDITII